MDIDKNVVLKTLMIITCFTIGSCNVQLPSLDPITLSNSQPLGECQACKVFIQSFQKGLERTARGKYEGGDAAWEEEKLKKSYKRSEMRLIDIQEGLCKEEGKNSVHCHHMAEKAEQHIEEWWAQDADESTDLYFYICIEGMKVCCPKHHYGKDCSPCQGDHENICNGNGKCRGDGTRKGNGTCLCNGGYTGEMCNECAIGYYSALKESTKLVCIPCHRACMGGCREGTHKDCVACKPGYLFDKDEGCVDINECDDINKCTKNQFCLNSLGSFSCLACDDSCNGCYGDGPDMCRKCAKGYSKKGELCVADRAEEDQTDKLTTTRNDEL